MSSDSNFSIIPVDSHEFSIELPYIQVPTQYIKFLQTNYFISSFENIQILQFVLIKIILNFPEQQIFFLILNNRMTHDTITITL